MVEETGIAAKDGLSGRIKQIEAELQIWKKTRYLYPAEKEKVKSLKAELKRLNGQKIFS